MTEDNNNKSDAPNENESEESFAELFESYSTGMREDLRVGDKIRGEIISISDSAVFVNTGTKADAMVAAEELRDKDGQMPFAIGDELELFVVAASESEIRLSKAISGVGGLSMLQEAYDNSMPVEGKVVQTIKGGFQVEVLQRRAFCPISQMDLQYVENTAEYVGQTYQFRIRTLAEGGRNIVLSRRDLLKEEQRQAHTSFLDSLASGQTYTGKVTRLMPYGAFVELIPGLEGMVHISELSWSRLEKPDDAVSPGDSIDVLVLDIADAPKGPKISLSAKQVSGDPWERLPEEIKAGNKVTGKVTRCAPFGAFVEVRPGIEGLVHISELSYTRRVLKPEEIVQPGQTISVLVKDVDLQKRRISLSLREAEGDPWLDVAAKYTVGQKITGTVEKQEAFGIFITLSPGIVGLLPKSVLRQSPHASKLESLKPGASIDVLIAAVKATERKISLALGDSDEESNWREFSDKQSDSTSTLGSLGEKLAEAMKKKP